MDITLRKSRKRPAIRFLVRCWALALAVSLALPVLPWPWTSMIVPAMSPYIMLCSAIAARALSMVSLFGIPVLIIVLLSRRWFCRYACPMGLLVELIGRLRPLAKAKQTNLPPVGQWIALLTLAGAFVGYPQLLWMDPLAMFNGFFGLFRQPLSAAVLVSGIGLSAVLIISVFAPNAWCGRICPLGATQDLLAALREAVHRVRSSQDQLPVRTPAGMQLARRSVLAVGLGAVWAAATLKTARNGVPKPIRPPGSIDERRFTGLCVRCGNCIKACPAGIIQPDPGRHGIAAFLTPVIRFEENYCLEDCRRCTEVCPSGAIAPLSLAEKKNAAIGLAKVDMSLCLLFDSQECSACVRQCPYEAIKIVFDDVAYTSTVRVDPRKCPGCGACEVACPTSPKAIRIVPRPS